MYSTLTCLSTCLSTCLPVQTVCPGVGEHPLQYNYTFWYSRRTPSRPASSQSYEQNIRQIGTVASVQTHAMFKYKQTTCHLSTGDSWQTPASINLLLVWAGHEDNRLTGDTSKYLKCWVCLLLETLDGCRAETCCCLFPVYIINALWLDAALIM